MRDGARADDDEITVAEKCSHDRNASETDAQLDLPFVEVRIHTSTMIARCRSSADIPARFGGSWPNCVP